jgi:hypothetical protein
VVEKNIRPALLELNLLPHFISGAVPSPVPQDNVRYSTEAFARKHKIAPWLFWNA